MPFCFDSLFFDLNTPRRNDFMVMQDMHGLAWLLVLFLRVLT